MLTSPYHGLWSHVLDPAKKEARVNNEVVKGYPGIPAGMQIALVM